MIFTLKERLNFELSAVLNLNYSVQLDEADSAQTVAPFAQNFCPWSFKQIIPSPACELVEIGVAVSTQVESFRVAKLTYIEPDLV